MLATVIDALNALLWTTRAVNGVKNETPPKPLPRPGVDDTPSKPEIPPGIPVIDTRRKKVSGD